MKKNIKAGATDQTLDIFVQDSSLTTGAGLTGLVFNTAGLVCYYRKGATGTPTALTLATQTVGGAHSDGGFVAVDGTNMPGVYRLDLSDTIVAAAGSVSIMLRGAANMAPVTIELQVVAYNPEDAVRMGLTALPNAAADAAGGLPISDAGGLDLDARLDAAVTSRASAAALATAQADLDTITGADGATLATAQALYAPSKAGDAMALTSGERTTLAAAIWNALTSGMSTVGSIGKKLADWTIHSAADVWAAATRTLTAGTNIALAKGTGVTGFTDLSAADVRTAVGLASANLDTQLDALPTNAELATALAAADDAVLAAIAALNNLSSAQAQTAAAAALTAYDPPTHAELTAGLASADDATLAAIAALNNLSAAQVNAEVVDALRTDTGTEVSAVPAAAAAISAQIQFLYQALRNKVLSGASLRIHNDAGTVVATKVQTDNGTSYQEDKAT